VRELRGVRASVWWVSPCALPCDLALAAGDLRQVDRVVAHSDWRPIADIHGHQAECVRASLDRRRWYETDQGPAMYLRAATTKEPTGGLLYGSRYRSHPSPLSAAAWKVLRLCLNRPRNPVATSDRCVAQAVVWDV
jgi:hypothetical protein